MANDQDMSGWTDLLHSSTKLLEQAAPSAQFPPLQRNLDQLEVLSKKLKAKTLRTEAPTQSIAATRLLAREGINAEQLARDLKSFELKWNIKNGEGRSQPTTKGVTSHFSTICKSLEKYMRDFIWEGMDEGNNFHLHFALEPESLWHMIIVGARFHKVELEGARFHKEELEGYLEATITISSCHWLGKKEGRWLPAIGEGWDGEEEGVKFYSGMLLLSNLLCLCVFLLLKTTFEDVFPAEATSIEEYLQQVEPDRYSRYLRTLENQIPKANYWRGRAKQLKYHIGHPF
ncbi:Nuclear pore complex protein NUP93A [Cucumis melo var. makuwa]|uniref:Nuclear pore complex protein NUP93A n=1 Tax=Cucumis melo var. makuwa TaxID=1194695 RepID=A0A5D3DPW0_CUCMM|nr:Nuclear pore complex protein NUP93A [Cucumis melo var. makuwa]